ncbi:MAG: poly-gamma-glutamate hydrolase family protein [Pseudomonadota bacterium]
MLSQIETFSPRCWDGPGSLTLKRGWGSFANPQKVIVTYHDGRKEEISADYFLVCTGSTPRSFQNIKVDQERILNSDGILNLKEFPKRLMIIGAGIIGCEYATMGNYQSYRELKENETLGKDYQIQIRSGKSGIAVMAPHGGGIEPGTTEIAAAVAGHDHTFYAFSGLKAQGNIGLHITSTRFDEPKGIEIAENSKAVLTIHGCKGQNKIVHLGGNDTRFKAKIKKALLDADFTVGETDGLPGKNPHNICNRNSLQGGVQLEVSSGLRAEFFPNHPCLWPKSLTPRFEQFIEALRHALSLHAGDLDKA